MFAAVFKDGVVDLLVKLLIFIFQNGRLLEQGAVTAVIDVSRARGGRILFFLQSCDFSDFPLRIASSHFVLHIQ